MCANSLAFLEQLPLITAYYNQPYIVPLSIMPLRPPPRTAGPLFFAKADYAIRQQWKENDSDDNYENGECRLSINSKPPKDNFDVPMIPIDVLNISW
jgi:hypothetical protein